MSKVKRPFFSGSASGSVGNEVTSKHNGRQDIISAWSKPTDGRTPQQLAVRACIDPCLALWRDLIGSEVGAWALECRRLHKRFTSYALFMQVNLARCHVGLPLWRVPGGPPGPFSAWVLDGFGDLQDDPSLAAGLYGYFEVAGDGSLEPAQVGAADTYFELDLAGDLQPIGV